MAGQGHGHGGHGSEGDEIVLHQENLKGVFLLAFVFALITVFGLSTAGGTKMSLLMGKDAYDKVQAQMPKLEHKESSTTEAKKEVPASEEKAPEAKTEEKK